MTPRVPGAISLAVGEPGFATPPHIVEAAAQAEEPDPRVHEGYEWLYVLNGRLRLVLGDRDLVLLPGEAAEFDTQLPHWFGSTGDGAVEILSIFGRPGERMHVRAQPASDARRG